MYEHTPLADEGRALGELTHTDGCEGDGPIGEAIERIAHESLGRVCLPRLVVAVGRLGHDPMLPRNWSVGGSSDAKCVMCG